MFLPEHLHRIAVVGVGCCGHNTINYIKKELDDNVDLFVFDTDSRGLESDERVTRMAIGQEITDGRSAGAIPSVGEKAAHASFDEIKQHLTGYDMIFIAGGLGGGTATGVIPVLTQMLSEEECLCVTIVTTPFGFEGKKKQFFAQEAITKINTTSDSCVTVSNQKLLHTMAKSSTLIEAFESSNQVLKRSLLGIYSLISTTGYINLDFADVRTVISGAGATVIGYGQGVGEYRIKQAVETALINPLLEDYDLEKAKAVLINITADHSLRLDEIHLAGKLLTEQIESEIPIIIGTVISDVPQDDIKIYAIFSGVEKKVSNLLKPKGIE
ncbi:cell division protein FtsZ [Vibrio ezurae]|uniref:Cell division protein FtsZ n=1 Tax=Vibrio ezurae NBRC 102218 TaxID=1219080 RepID=U3CJD5_9VIBR|nr:cell division protein FtsZ [Vibrio ezurae]GAD81264.1 cell division protein FtsZ [Vibrio ezurae NBRC 102218]